MSRPSPLATYQAISLSHRSLKYTVVVSTRPTSYAPARRLTRAPVTLGDDQPVLVFPGRDDPAAQEAIKAKARISYEEYLREIDGLLNGKKWCFDNRFTVVDGYLLVFYRWGNRQKMPVRELKNYSALMDRVLARPAVKKVMADEGITLD